MEKTYPSTILVFLPEITPRVEYTFKFIFQTILGVEVVYTTSLDEFIQSEFAKINYSSTNMSSGLFLKPHPLLFEKKIDFQEIVEVQYDEYRLFFPSSEDSFLPFDPFACTFYLISRYEEYLSENTDQHERFTETESVLYQLQMHQKPLVDLMAYWIANKLSNQFPEFKIQERSFRFLTTIDVDNAWAFKNKSWLILLGATLKAAIRGQWSEIKQRLVVSLGLQKDPYDTYKYILETYAGQLNHILFFFLIGNRNSYDKNISHKNKHFRELISSLASICAVGIHPSYASNEKPWLFEKEKDRLETIIKKPVTQSRQHYLKLRFPKTYQNLIKTNITDDYTMGFANLVGFRAGTCTPFPFFDLSNNKETRLMVHPFQAMDVTLKNYLHLTPEKAMQLIQELMLEVKNVDGTFISLWHNESLKDSDQWLEWHKIFEQILETGLNYSNEES